MGQWSIPLDRIAKQTGIRIETVARKVTFDLYRNVVLKSPVDTGRFRANWNVSFGVPSYTTTGSTDAGRGLQEAGKALSLPVGGVVFLSNGLAYARRLEMGYSRQAPIGMVRTSVVEFQSFVNRAIQ